MPHAWTFQVNDPDGNLVETAPGQKRITMRGPRNKAALIRQANRLLGSRRRAATREGFDDPGYVLDESSIKYEGNIEGPVGQWRPASAAPLSLPTDPAVQEAKNRRLAEEIQAGDLK
jgi:hypothetical protein